MGRSSAMTRKAYWAYCFLFLFSAGQQLIAAQSLDQNFDRDEPVQLIVVQLATGETGQAVDETLALDLGLGFPLWLGSLGRDADTAIPFGAVSDQTEPVRTMEAGQGRTFRFDIAGSAINDPLETLPALLDDVRVSDISRIGLLATGESDWCLSEFSITINGKPFYSSAGLDVHVQNEQALAEARLSELGGEVDPMVEQAESLRELVGSGLATDDEAQQLRDLGAVIVPKLQERSRIERQIQGSYPWYLARDFRSPWRNGHDVESMSVTLIVAPHRGAETRNYVYYQTGGRKYLLSSPANPLTHESGPQTFAIDLIGGPATASDLRGHSVGMLGTDQPQGDTPDRAHVQRMLVEVDGRIVYDSDESELDRLSLEATWLIPPAHRSASGAVVVNTPVPREAFVWNAGEGQGLDLVHGGAHALPPPTDPTWPRPEADLVHDAQVETMEELQPGFQAGFEPFPGESYDTPDWSVSYEESFHAEGNFPPPGGGPWAADPWAGGGWGGDPWATDPWSDPWGGAPWSGGGFDPWGWGPPPSWLDVLAGALLGHFGTDVTVIEEIIEEVVADPIGDPPQIHNLIWDLGLMPTGEVTWDVTGDESDIARYEIEIFMFWPNRADPIGVPVASMTAGPGARHAVVDLDDVTLFHAINTDPLSVYTISRITPILLSTGEPAPGQFGIVQTINFGTAPIVALNPTYRYLDSGGVANDQLLLIGDPMMSMDRAAWIDPAPMTHLGFV